VLQCGVAVYVAAYVAVCVAVCVAVYVPPSEPYVSCKWVRLYIHIYT